MTTDALVVVGRDGHCRRETLETHADRLARRGTVDSTLVATYESEPVRELRDELGAVTTDRVYVLPACVAHDRETTDVLPGTFPYLAGEIRYCEPIGRSSAVTRLLTERARAHVPAAEDATVVLVSRGSSSQPYHRQMLEYHASRIAERSAFEAVEPCYLLQNPAVECVRYNVDTDRAVAVPLFVTANETTEQHIPAKLELERGGMAYADPLGDHPLVTDAIESEIARQRALVDSDREHPATFEGTLAKQSRSVATDGDGRAR